MSGSVCPVEEGWKTVGQAEEDYEEVMVTADSGAADTVGPPSIARHIPVSQTWASLGGSLYATANGNPLP